MPPTAIERYSRGSSSDEVIFHWWMPPPLQPFQNLQCKSRPDKGILRLLTEQEMWVSRSRSAETTVCRVIIPVKLTDGQAG